VSLVPAITSNYIDKINFAPHKADQIEALHQRVADRLKWVIDVNQGLYLKLGQALGRSIKTDGD
jgi:predicted unusual protein kinase regulating ubiquinone biosynthesis (AarF/ABC1/UbiB family)